MSKWLFLCVHQVISCARCKILKAKKSWNRKDNLGGVYVLQCSCTYTHEFYKRALEKKVSLIINPRYLWNPQKYFSVHVFFHSYTKVCSNLRLPGKQFVYIVIAKYWLRRRDSTALPFSDRYYCSVTTSSIFFSLVLVNLMYYCLRVHSYYNNTWNIKFPRWWWLCSEATMPSSLSDFKIHFRYNENFQLTSRSIRSVHGVFVEEKE